jgi:hypothetical protein
MGDDMRKEMERGESVEILPENIGEMPALKAAPLLERAASRTEVLGWGGEFWEGLRENLRGAKAWVESHGAEATKKTLSAITTAAFVTTCFSACVNVPITPDIPSITAPGVTEVTPSATTISAETAPGVTGVFPPTTDAPTSTEVPTSTATSTEIPTETATAISPEAQVLAELNSEIQPVSDITISGKVHDTIPISIELVTSASLNNPAIRSDRLMGPVGLSETYPGDAKQAVLKTVFKGIYYAWQVNDETQADARKNVTEDQFAQMWKDGKDITTKIWAYDMMTQNYVWKDFDPRTQTLEGVFLDKNAGKTVQKLLVHETTYSDTDAYATVLTPDGKIQLWMYLSATFGYYPGPGLIASKDLLLALQRLAWFPDQQTTSHADIARSPDTYHTDMTNLMIIWTKGTGYFFPLSAPAVVKK